MGAYVEQTNSTREQMLIGAVDHLRTALQLLDAAEAPAQIGAHVDLALNQLQAEVVSTSAIETIPPETSSARH